MIVFDRRSLVIDRDVRRRVLAPVVIPPKTSKIQILIARPTALNPRAWGDADTFAVSAYVTLDDEEYLFMGRATGGQRLRAGGAEIGQYALSFAPPYGFFGREEMIRLGERSKSRYELRVEIDAFSGTADTEIEVLLDEEDAPRIALHRSISFDTATDAAELSGDGVLSLAHTAAGDKLAALAGSGNSSSGAGQTSSSFVYDGVGMTEFAELASGAGSFSRSAGYSLAGPSTGAGVTVTNTLAGATDEHIIAVLTFAGVDQSAPVGTAGTNTNNSGSATSSTATAPSVNPTDVVVDYIYVSSSVDPANAVGADQTSRTTENVAGCRGSSSTQPGSVGGDMSWTFGDSDFGICHWAIALKEAAGSPPMFRGS